MTGYAWLLRAVNLGAHNKVSMPALRDVMTGLGHAGVATHLQSGNVVFRSDRSDVDALAAEIAAALEQATELTIDVLVRTHTELAAVVEANPFPEAADQPATLHAVFLDGRPDPAAVAALDRKRFAPDRFSFGDLTIYVHYPNGAGRSKLSPDVWRRLGVVATARNWNTVTKLVELTR